MLSNRNIIEVFYNSEKIGSLTITQDNLAAFEYHKEYLINGVSISPFYLPLKSGVFIAKREPFKGLFGVFNDSLPDGWGALLTDRLLMKYKIKLSNINFLDRLSLIGNSGMGALTYFPKWDMKIKKGGNTDLNEIAKKVEQILLNNYSGNIEEVFMIFRLMVFNVLTHNRDDHAKNFSFILQNNEWELSPSYDLVLSDGFNGEHTTTVAGNGNPSKKDIFEVAKQTGLSKKRANQIFDEVYENTREIAHYSK